MARKEELARQWERTMDYLFNKRPAFERDGAAGYKPGLGTSIALDKLYKEPHSDYRIIHIAGTNGKGSTAHMLASCLQECGYRVGLFTSPHLIDFRERIRVNGKKVSRNYVMQWVTKYKQLHFEDIEPTFFEIISTMAFDYFKWRNVNVAVVETGLGGRLDSTNIITPDLSIITNVGLDHQQFLGNTLTEIASEKAGIIKPGKPVVIGRAEGEVHEIFEQRAADMQSRIRLAQEKNEVTGAVHTDGMLRITTKNYGTIDCELTGDYQVENVNTVLVTLNELKRNKYRVKEGDVRHALGHVTENTGLMGRWMKVADEPLTICDSAHNPAAFEQVLRQLKNENSKKLHLVLGFMADKDVKSILAMMPKDAAYYFTKANIQRSMTAKKLQQAAAKAELQGDTYSNVTEALEAARKAAGKDDLIYVGGSMYVLAELLQGLGYGDDDKD